MRVLILFIIVLLFSAQIYSQEYIVTRNINWRNNIHLSNNKEKFNFDNAYFPDTLKNFPYFLEHFELPVYCEVKLSDIIYEKLEFDKTININHLNQLPDTFQLSDFSGKSRNKIIINIKLLPLCRDTISNFIYRLKSFSISFYAKHNINKKEADIKSVEHSVLSNGKWYKIKLKDNGIYKLTYSQLKSLGFDNPGNIRLYGNAGGMLPLMTNKPRPDDLRENAIEFVEANQGTFKDGDYILFYGQSPDVWYYNAINKRYYHSQNKFTDYNYYFLTDYYGSGKTVEVSSEPSSSNYINVNSFDDYAYHELDNVNLIASGSEWYGEYLTPQNPVSFTFSFPDIDTTSNAYVYYNVIGRSSTTDNYFLFETSGNSFNSPYIYSIDKFDTEGAYAQEASGSFTFSPTTANILLYITYESTDADGAGYINYIGVNTRRKLIYKGNQLQFRNIRSVGIGNVANYIIENGINDLEIWDITDACLPWKMNSTISGSGLSFIAAADSLRQFIVFNSKSGFLSPIINGSDDIGIIENQDIHGAANPDLIIVSPPDTDIFDQAKILADYRSTHDSLRVLLTSTDKVYNEFSSGKKDVAAIRDMVRMFYKRSESKNDMVRYLLLFGKGTFDNKTIDPNNKNLIPTYESANSLNQSNSYVSDDFFGWMNDTSSDENNLLDVGVGRLPVKNAYEAENVVNKILNYDKPATMDDWRNVICFIAEDGDENLHIGQADGMAESISKNYPFYNINKIYLDAYHEVSTDIGLQYPDASTAINNRINKGSLIVNYTGHGNEKQLTHANVIYQGTILSWTNFNSLAIFVTATCEFGRFDDVNIVSPGTQFEIKTSGGENILLNPKGGGIALLTTTRIVYADRNSYLNNAFYNNVFSKDNNGNYLRLGDIIRLTKNDDGGDLNRLNFTLLGDPSTVMAYPKIIGVITDSVNGQSIKNITDTLKALSLARISGHVQDNSGTILNTFNGNVYPTVFDKEEKKTTLGNPAWSGDYNTPFNYNSWDNIVFKGASKIENGKFSFYIPVPKDINYDFGKGKIIYYAKDSSIDLTGYTDSLIIGGLSENVSLDTAGPKLNLYMNDTNFISGGITNSDPELYIKIFDRNGINMSGSGIGHDLTAIIDNDFADLISLNDYYQSELNDYRRGSALYPLYNVNPGLHNIKVIAWDVYNNSSSGEISFRVLDNNNFVINRVLNYPNPFSNSTKFVVEHNWPDGNVNIEIRIFSLSGQEVSILKAQGIPTGFRTPIYWNGTDFNGRNLDPGIYLFHIKMSTNKGETAESYGKIAIVR